VVAVGVRDTGQGRAVATLLPPPEVTKPGEPRSVQTVLAWLALVLGLLVVPVAALPILSPVVRLPVVLAFICLGPGAAFVSLVRMGDAVSSWATAFVLSLALTGAVASIMVWTGWWSAAGGFAVLAVPTTAIAYVVLRSTWYPPPVEPVPSPTVRLSPSPLPQSAVHDQTALLFVPRQRDSDATSLLPKATDSGATSLLPKATDSGETSLLPKATDSGATSLPPKATDSGETAVFDRIDDIPDETATWMNWGPVDDRTTRLPRIPRQAGPPSSVPPGGPATAVLRDVVRNDDASADDGRDHDATGRADLRGLLPGIGTGAMALGCWLISLAFSSLDNLGEYGLLAAVHPTFVLALCLCVGGFIAELARRRRHGWILLAHVGILILIMRATVPLLSPEPEYAWTYKHIGVVDLFLRYGQVVDGYDIYQQWPTLFALVAHLVDASGADVFRIAAWAPFFFNIAACVPLFALARTLSTDARVPYLTVFLYTGTNWVGQDYLAPQAFAFTLALGTLFVIIRWLRRTAGGGQTRFKLLERLWTPVAAGLQPVPYTSKLAAWAATGAMSVIFAVVVAAHQLTPYLVAMSAVALVVLGLVRSYRIIPILLGLAVGYVVPRYDVVDDYGLFQGFNFFSNARTVTSSSGATAIASEGRAFNVNVTMLVALVVWGLAALAVISALRRLGPVAVPGLLAFAPFGLLLAQSYGGEAVFRVYLFSAPWCAFLIATLALSRRWLPSKLGLSCGALALLLGVLGSLQAGQGQAMTTVFTRDDVAIARYLYTHAEPHSTVLLAAGSFPTRLTADYADFLEGVLIGPNDRLGPYELSDAGADALDSHFDDGLVTYLVFSPSMTSYLAYYGYMPPETLVALRRQIDASPRWELVTSIGEAAIYRRASGQTTARPGPYEDTNRQGS
jgi:hypothetical protein